jgi:hypothetical protein
MRKFLSASALALFGLAAAPAGAMPFPSLSDAPSVATPVAFGCGPGWTRGPYGRCHPIGGPGYGYGYGYGYVGPRVYGYGGVRHCWRGAYGVVHCRVY